MKNRINSLLLGFAMLLQHSCVINVENPEKAIHSEPPPATQAAEFSVSDSEELNGLLAGFWTGSYMIDPQTPVDFETARYSNGEYEAYYTIHHPDGSESLIMEKGEWGVSGTVYSTITKQAMRSDMQEPDLIRLTDSYTITFFDGNQLEYCHVYSDRCISAIRADQVAASTSAQETADEQAQQELYI